MTRPTDALRLVPVDTGPNFSDSSLPLDMIYAGADAIDRATDDMANYVSGETIDWDSGMMAVAVYRAMLAAAPASPLPEGGGWQDISTAPKDGTWIQAWRTPPSFTGGRWEPLVYVRWDDEQGSWVWPCDMFEVFTVRGRELADMAIADDDYYSSPDFIHWMPLPAAPTGAK